jgi:predicted nucleotidyltransferase
MAAIAPVPSLPLDLLTILTQRLNVTEPAIIALCQQWKITELALFGSVLREDFRPDSDVDVLITFAPHHGWNLLDFVDLKADLESLFHREVDFLQKKELKNPYRSREILRTHRVVYGNIYGE